jgi:hypothetical protein
MPHVDFDVNTVQFTDFFQEGGSRDIYFEGIPFQRGYGKEHRAGIGAVFRSLLRVLLPVMKKAGSAVKKEGLETGARILSDVAQGVPVKEAVVAEVKTGAKHLAEKALQRGGGRRRRRSRKRKSAKRRSVSKKAKRRKADTLGFY